MIFGYARVGSKKQLKDNCLEEQTIKLLACGCNEVIEEEFTEKATNNRPRLDELIGRLSLGDTLMVTKLDSLTRDLTQAYKLIMELRNREINVTILNIGIIDSTDSGKSILNIFLSLSEFEKDVMLERIQEGKAIAEKQEGYRAGRKPKFSSEEKEYALSLLSSNGGDKSYIQVSEDTGISVSTLVRSMRRNKSKYKDWICFWYLYKTCSKEELI